MKEFDLDVPNISIIKGFRNGIKSVSSNIKSIFKNIAILTAIMALAVMVTAGGNIGVVKVDYINYMPYHEISTLYLAKYIIGTAITLLLFVIWRGKAFLLLANNGKTTDSSTPKHVKTSDVLYSALRMLQFCLLAFIIFGIIASILIYLSLTLSAWLWIATAAYLLFVSVPLYISCYEYMLTDNNFRHALKIGFQAVKEQWGRIFLRLLIVNAVFALLIFIFALPAASLIMSIYDNATAVTMSGASATPSFIYILEYAAIFISSALTLLTVFASMSILQIFFNDVNKYSQHLSAIKTENI